MKIQFDERLDPRLDLEIQYDTSLPQDHVISVLVDLQFINTNLFPQDVVSEMLSDQDLLADYGLFIEYFPYLGFHNPVIVPTECPEIVSRVFSLISSHPLNQEPDYIDI